MPIVWDRFKLPIIDKDEGYGLIMEFYSRAERNDEKKLEPNDKIWIRNYFTPDFLDHEIYSSQSDDTNVRYKSTDTTAAWT